MPSVLLATCSDMPRGEPGAYLLDRALSRRGVAPRWAAWDDPAVDWASADLVAVRSTWDYQERLPEFLAWVDALPGRVLNPAPVLRWNVDKAYLVELGREVPVVPTVAAETEAELAAAVADVGRAVVKPRVGASGVGVQVVRAGDRVDAAGPWVVQPLVESVRTVGEVSVFVLGGRAVSRVDKRPAAGEVRVHEEYGGSTVRADLDPETSATAAAALAAVGTVLGEPPGYGRVDLLRHDGGWLVSELELTEPGLYLDVLPENAEPFADLVVRSVG